MNYTKNLTLGLMLTLGTVAVAKPQTDWFARHANDKVTEALIKEAVKHTYACKYYSITREGEYVIKRIKPFKGLPFIISSKLPLTDIKSKCGVKPLPKAKTERWDRQDPRWDSYLLQAGNARSVCYSILNKYRKRNYKRKWTQTTMATIKHCLVLLGRKKK